MRQRRSDVMRREDLFQFNPLLLHGQPHVEDAFDKLQPLLPLGDFVEEGTGRTAALHHTE